MSIDQIVSLTHELKRLGCKCSLSLSVHLPIDEDEPTKATMKTVLWALNRLKAAPGQPSRDVIRAFLFYRGWIQAAEEPEEWDLQHVPTSVEALKQLSSDILKFDQDRHAPGPS